MIYRRFIVMSLAVLLAANVYAEGESATESTFDAEEEHALDPQYMFTDAEDNAEGDAAEKKQVISMTASGEQQTTIIDDNGNLRIIDKSQPQQAPATEPRSLQSMPPAPAPNNAPTAPGGQTPNNTMNRPAPNMPMPNQQQPMMPGGPMPSQGGQYPGQAPNSMQQYPGGQYPQGQMPPQGGQYPSQAPNTMQQQPGPYPQGPGMMPGNQYPAPMQNAPGMAPDERYPSTGQNSTMPPPVTGQQVNGMQAPNSYQGGMQNPNAYPNQNNAYGNQPPPMPAPQPNGMQGMPANNAMPMPNQSDNMPYPQ